MYLQLAAPYVWHLVGHDGQEKNIRIKGQAVHIQNRLGYCVRVHSRLHQYAAIGLGHAGFHAFGHLCGRVADIDLATADVVLATI